MPIQSRVDAKILNISVVTFYGNFGLMLNNLKHVEFVQHIEYVYARAAVQVDVVVRGVARNLIWVGINVN